MPQGGITVRSVHRPGELPVTTADASNPRSLLTTPERLASVAFGLWMVVGLFLDGWAHDNAKPESFFTPWHGVLYSGFAASAAAAVLVARSEEHTSELQSLMRSSYAVFCLKQKKHIRRKRQEQND